MGATSFSEELMGNIKARFKSKNITQSEISTALGVSLPTVKRWLSGQGATIENAKTLCEFAGVSFAELVEEVEDPQPIQYTFSPKEEKFLSNNLGAYAFLNYLLEGYTPTRIKKKFNIGQSKANGYLKKLEENGFLEWLPNNKVKLFIDGEPIWARGGPLAKKLKPTIIEEFLKDKINGDFLMNELLPEDIIHIKSKSEELFTLIAQAEKKAKKYPDLAKSFGTYFYFKSYRWPLDKFL